MRTIPTILCAAAATLTGAAGAQSLALTPSVHPPQSQPFDVFGTDVAMWSPIYCAVGVRGADTAASNAGAVDTFDLKEGIWTYRQRLMPLGLASGDQFGHAISATDEWLAAGATRHDASGSDAGAVWVYRREGLSWVSPQKLIPGMGSDGARFGMSVGLGDGRLAIGAPGTAPGGVVHLYRFVEGKSNGGWVLETTIANPSPAEGDRFGECVALEGARLLVADPFDDAVATDRGAVYTYVHDGGAWSPGSTLVPAVSSDRQYYGRSISLRGTRLAIGAYGADSSDGAIASSGAVEVYDLVGGNWSRSAELRPVAPSQGGNFGWEVAIEAGTLLVGEPGWQPSDGSGTRQGRVHLYARQPSAQWAKVADFGTVDGQTEEIFGTAIAILSGKAAITAPGRDERRGALLAANLLADCDQNEVADVLQIAADPARDCNGDMLLDDCQTDSDGDGVPNLCDCPADVTSDGAIGSSDLSFVLAEWGNFGGNPADINGDLVVDAADLSLLLLEWGVCE